MCGRLPFNHQMDIYEIRRERLVTLIDSQCNGRQAELSARTGIKATQINRWISTKNNSPRRITEDSARAIESKMALPSGWLDQPDITMPAITPAPVLVARQPTKRYATGPIGEVVAIMERFSEAEQLEALRAVRFIEAECRERRQNSTQRAG